LASFSFAERQFFLFLALPLIRPHAFSLSLACLRFDFPAACIRCFRVRVAGSRP
jgi:hypothetical protein